MYSLNATGRETCGKVIMQDNIALLSRSTALAKCLPAFWRGWGWMYSVGFWVGSFMVHNGQIWGLNTRVHCAAQIKSIPDLQEIFLDSSVIYLLYGWGRIESGARNSFQCGHKYLVAGWGWAGLAPQNCLSFQGWAEDEMRDIGKSFFLLHELNTLISFLF